MIARDQIDNADLSQLDNALQTIMTRHCPRSAAERFSRIPVTLIQICVAHACGIKPAMLLTHRRYHQLAEPRQIAMYLATKLTDGSSPQLGRQFHRDHSTILNARDKVVERMASDAHFAVRVRELENLICSVHSELRLLVETEPGISSILTAA